MPFKSHEQEAYLKHNHPDIYKRWVKKYGHYKGEGLGIQDKKKKKKKRS